MSVFAYQATDELSPGTAQDEQVSRDFRIVSFPRRIKSIRRQNTALGGAVESILLRQEKHYSCTTEVLEPRGLVEQQIIEFFASVQNGEGFTFDRYGTPAQPDNPVSCIMVSDNVTGAEQAKKFHQYGFTIRES